MMLQLERSAGLSVLLWAPCPVSGLHGGCTGRFVWGSSTARDSHSPWAEVDEENHEGDSSPCVSAASSMEDKLWYPLPAQKYRLQMNPSSVLQCQCACSDDRMRVSVTRTELQRLSSVSKLIYLNFQGCFFSHLSTSELSKARAQLNFGLTEHPQLEPAQWEDEVLAASGRKVLTLHWKFQEWEIFLWFIFVALVVFVYCSSKIEAFLQYHSTRSSSSSWEPQTK